MEKYNTERQEDINELLLKCSRNGWNKAINSLLKKTKGKSKIDVNTRGSSKHNKNQTPLHMAAYFGHVKVAKMLLQNGAAVNAIDTDGDTPLHRSSLTSRPDVVMLLLNYGADVFSRNYSGFSAKDMAGNSHIKSMIEAAEVHQLNVYIEEFFLAVQDGDCDSVLHKLNLPNGPDVNCKWKYGNTALHLACMQNSYELATLLLMEGGNPLVRNYFGCTAVDMAQDDRMKEILSIVRPAKFPAIPSKREGFIYYIPLGDMKRFLVTVKLDLGELAITFSRDGLTSHFEDKLIYLKNASATKDGPSSFTVSCAGSNYKFQVVTSPDHLTETQNWVKDIRMHIDYCNFHTTYDASSMVFAFKSLQVAEEKEHNLEAKVNDLQDAIKTHSSDCCSDFISRLKHIVTAGQETCQAFVDTTSLLVMLNQKMMEELHAEKEKSYWLQESLHALSHDVDHVISRRHRRTSSHCSDGDEFYECADHLSHNAASSNNVTSNEVNVTSNDVNVTSNDIKVTNNGNLSNKQKAPLGRTKLPEPMFSRSEFSVWSILKQCVGKELSKITMPVIFNEPISFLQRIAEYLEYANIVHKASDCDNVVERLEYVTAFAVSAISSNWERVGKPFNPLLGETYELNRPDLGFRLVSEQVSHHPPISAFHVDSSIFKFSGSVYPKLKFWGKSVEVIPKGTMQLELLRHNEVYTWQNVSCCVHNVIIGKLWVEHYGVMNISNLKTKHSSTVNFHQGGWFGKDLHRLSGYIYSPEKKKLKALYGSWLTSLYVATVNDYDSFYKKSESKKDYVKKFSFNKHHDLKSAAHYHSVESLKEDDDIADECPTVEVDNDLHIPGQKCLWRVEPRPTYSHQYFNFTKFSMILNELSEDMARELPPTDTRFRPDIRHLERSSVVDAATEKNRLEEKQRTTRKEMQKNNATFQPRWFELLPNKYTGKKEWTFSKHYYEKNWLNSPNIY